MKTLVLGSNSPRRKEILSQLGFSFEVRTSNIEEIVPEKLPVFRVAEHLAIQKNKAISKSLSEVVICADTTVIIDNLILGKPIDANEAKYMLGRLSGRSHKVVTGVCISSDSRLSSFAVTTTVEFHRISKEQIAHYVSTYSPLDKAGAYGIQEWIGYVAIRNIEGSYLNVVGLPADRVYNELVNNFEIRPLG